ncbi:hypothetical protein Fot_12604 [Forsythia ovata]|uniref:Uncharacterized protein n=1 Tax=Forsythia ovata TaxID=205694 RepID=A0ABD1WN26_9LAMI
MCKSIEKVRERGFIHHRVAGGAANENDIVVLTYLNCNYGFVVSNIAESVMKLEELSETMREILMIGWKKRVERHVWGLRKDKIYTHVIAEDVDMAIIVSMESASDCCEVRGSVREKA